MTTNTPMISPQDFMAQPADPDEDLTVPEWVHSSGCAPDPLDSIADSLKRLVAIAEGDAEEERVSDALRERYDDLDAKHATLYELLEEIEVIVKPSTSKLANQVREAVTRWRAPEVLAPDPAVDPQPSEPAPDADVEVWRAYARGRGYQGADVDAMNRSQLRTMLGIAQPVAVVEGASA